MLARTFPVIKNPILRKKEQTGPSFPFLSHCSVPPSPPLSCLVSSRERTKRGAAADFDPVPNASFHARRRRPVLASSRLRSSHRPRRAAWIRRARGLEAQIRASEAQPYRGDVLALLQIGGCHFRSSSSSSSCCSRFQGESVQLWWVFGLLLVFFDWFAPAGSRFSCILRVLLFFCARRNLSLFPRRSLAVALDVEL